MSQDINLSSNLPPKKQISQERNLSSNLPPKK